LSEGATPMNNEFLQVCEREFAAQAKLMFDNAPRIRNTRMAEIPGGRFLLDFPVPPCLLQRVCMALGAVEQFRRDAPAWAPSLPLYQKDIAALVESDGNPRLNAVGLYANSLSWVEFDYQLHPSFGTYVSGLLAYEFTPIEIRIDHQLQLEFPPKPLAGLCDGRMSWRSPAMIEVDRDIEARGKALDARYAAERMGA
jgi:hypothetical protein